MRVSVHFYSYFKDLAGVSECELEMLPGTTVRDLLAALHKQFPKLAPMAKSTLVAVGVEYQPAGYELRDKDEVSLFPPVQGG